MNELDLNSPEAVRMLLEIIDKKIDNRFDQLKFDSSLSATVVSVGNGVANITQQGGTKVIDNVPNKTGETLSVGNQVVVEAINNSKNNLVIKYKK